jgi:hypothetical protein
MKGYQVISSGRGVVIREAISLRTETSFGTLREALAHLEKLVDLHGTISVQIDTQQWDSMRARTSLA